MCQLFLFLISHIYVYYRTHLCNYLLIIHLPLRLKKIAMVFGALSVARLDTWKAINIVHFLVDHVSIYWIEMGYEILLQNMMFWKL